MNAPTAKKRVVLSDRHLRPGRTKHTITNKNGSRDFPPFVYLEIMQYPNEESCYLFHICASGEIADTWHESVEDAMCQAEYEFGVQTSEWMDVKPSFKNVYENTRSEKSYRCPCCGFKTLYGRGQYEVCPVCFWEDDGQDDHDADEVRGGPNCDLSLRQARSNFRDFGASDARCLANVRAPFEGEF